jgi:predicted flavoprotein YhiN
MDMAGMSRVLEKEASDHGTRRIGSITGNLPLPGRLVRRLVELAGIPPGMTGANLSREARLSLAGYLAECPFVVERPGGFEEAMVTRGGVALDGISRKTMESLIIPGLYFIGEVLDIDGDTGGYNLQAAFSTAASAAAHISKNP